MSTAKWRLDFRGSSAEDSYMNPVPGLRRFTREPEWIAGLWLIPYIAFPIWAVASGRFRLAGFGDLLVLAVASIFLPTFGLMALLPVFVIAAVVAAPFISLLRFMIGRKSEAEPAEDSTYINDDEPPAPAGDSAYPRRRSPFLSLGGAAWKIQDGRFRPVKVLLNVETGRMFFLRVPRSVRPEGSDRGYTRSEAMELVMAGRVTLSRDVIVPLLARPHTGVKTFMKSWPTPDEIQTMMSNRELPSLRP